MLEPPRDENAAVNAREGEAVLPHPQQHDGNQAEKDPSQSEEKQIHVSTQYGSVNCNIMSV